MNPAISDEPVRALPFPNKFYQFTYPAGKAWLAWGEESEPTTWYRVHTTTGTSSDCVTIAHQIIVPCFSINPKTRDTLHVQNLCLKNATFVLHDHNLLSDITYGVLITRMSSKYLRTYITYIPMLFVQKQKLTCRIPLPSMIGLRWPRSSIFVLFKDEQTSERRKRF